MKRFDWMLYKLDNEEKMGTIMCFYKWLSETNIFELESAIKHYPEETKHAINCGYYFKADKKIIDFIEQKRIEYQYDPDSQNFKRFANEFSSTDDTIYPQNFKQFSSKQNPILTRFDGVELTFFPAFTPFKTYIHIDIPPIDLTFNPQELVLIYSWIKNVIISALQIDKN